MTHLEFRNIRAELHLTQEALGRRLGLDEATIRRYETAPGMKSHRPIPAPVEILMRLQATGYRLPEYAPQ